MNFSIPELMRAFGFRDRSLSNPRLCPRVRLIGDSLLISFYVPLKGFPIQSVRVPALAFSLKSDLPRSLILAPLPSVAAFIVDNFSFPKSLFSALKKNPRKSVLIFPDFRRKIFENC